MPRTVRTARGDLVDFDAIIIKQQIAQAPMNIEVQRRKDFIDSKEGKVRGQRKVPVIAGTSDAVDAETIVDNFEIAGAPEKIVKSAPVEAIPVMPVRDEVKTEVKPEAKKT
jgi:hypothetical protein